MLQDFHGIVSLLRQVFAAPLGQAITGGGGAVAETGGQGLCKPWTAEITGKECIHQGADAFKDIAPFDEFLIVGSGRGDVEIVPLAGVELGIYPVQGKGNLRQDVGPQRGDMPGGVNLAGGDVFDVIQERDGDIFCVTVWGA